MEHKLLLGGGEQYLPFARSRIKAMRATGLAHLSQKFEIEGVTVHVWIEPGHEYIRISGGSATLAMDSGVVDMLALGVLHADTFKAGILHPTTYVASYIAGFVDATPPSSKGKVKPSPDSTGQFVGYIEFDKKVSGYLKPLGEGSYFPTTVAAGTDPETYIDKTDDYELFSKKYLTAKCPASMFTGRTKQYVQALYGRALYEFNANKSVKAGTGTAGLFIASGIEGASPALLVRSYENKSVDGDSMSGVRVLVDTNVGVHVDADFNMWMFGLAGSTIAVYPLIATAAAHKLRVFLRSKDGKKLSAAEVERAISYIMAYSLPYAKRRQLADGSTGSGYGYAMGYGWHWNRSGTKADVVNNAVMAADDLTTSLATFFMRSTHYRFEVTKAPIAEPEGGFATDDPRWTWTCTPSIISGPSDWGANRVAVCIAAPAWDSYTLGKETPSRCIFKPGNATVYAFYRGDELVTADIVVSTGGERPPMRTKSERYATGDVAGVNDVTEETFGLEGGFYRDQRLGYEFPIYTITCTGGASYTIISGKVDIYDEGELFGKSAAPQDYSGYSWSLPLWGGWVTEVTYTRKLFTRHEEQQGLLTLIVPFNDAEAVYLHGEGYTQTITSGSQGTQTATIFGGGWISRTKQSDDGGGTWYEGPTTYGWGLPGNAGEVEWSAFNTNDITPLPGITKCICSAGVLDATFTHISDFHNNDPAFDNVGTQYGSLSSVNGAFAAQYHVAPQNMPVELANKPIAFVGWA